MAETVRVSAQCHCTAQTFHVHVPRSSLPLLREMCHCYDCRHITGMLACDFVRLPPLDENLFDESAVPAGLSMYKTPGGHVGWYFCDKCGAHVVQSSSRDGGKTTTWLFSLGTLYPLALDDGTPTSTLKYHSYVNYGEHQGGLSRFLPDGVPRYVDNTETVPASQDTKPTAEQEAEIERASVAPTLPLACHCGKVQLRLHRPASGPIEDKFVRTARGERWLWTLCLCHSCRTTAGFDATPFLFVPYSHLTSGKPDEHPTTGLTRYTGYPGRNRYFCPTCGACALFEDIERGALYDIYLGLVQAPLAALFTSWGHKSQQLSYWPYAKNKEMANFLAKGYSPGMNAIQEDEEDSLIAYNGTLQV